MPIHPPKPLTAKLGEFIDNPDELLSVPPPPPPPDSKWSQVDKARSPIAFGDKAAAALSDRPSARPTTTATIFEAARKRLAEVQAAITDLRALREEEIQLTRILQIENGVDERVQAAPPPTVITNAPVQRQPYEPPKMTRLAPVVDPPQAPIDGRNRGGKMGPKPKISDADVVRIRELSKSGETAVDLAKQYRISAGYVYQLVTGMTRASAGGPIRK